MNSKLSKKISTGVVALLVAVCFIPLNAAAFVPGEGPHDKGIHRKGHHRSALGVWRNQVMAEKLELTTEQVMQIREADFAYREKQLPLKAQLESLRLQMEKAFSNDTVDDAAVLSLAEQISDVKGKMFVQGIESRLALKKILSADQIEKLKLHSKHQKRHDQRRGKNCNPKHHSLERSNDKKLSSGINE